MAWRVIIPNDWLNIYHPAAFQSRKMAVVAGPSLLTLDSRHMAVPSILSVGLLLRLRITIVMVLASRWSDHQASVIWLHRSLVQTAWQ